MVILGLLEHLTLCKKKCMPHKIATHPALDQNRGLASNEVSAHTVPFTQRRDADGGMSPRLDVAFIVSRPLWVRKPVDALQVC
eukprot:SAG11_NODE_2880_length_2875_cov_3.094020_4_plen_83_part_00